MSAMLKHHHPQGAERSCRLPAGVFECAVCVEVHDVPQALVKLLIAIAFGQAVLEQLHI